MFTDMRLLVLNYPKYIGFCYLCLGICSYRHHLSKAFLTIFCKFCVFVLFSPLNWAFLIQKCQEKVCATSNSSLLWCYGADKLPILVSTSVKYQPICNLNLRFWSNRHGMLRFNFHILLQVPIHGVNEIDSIIRGKASQII